MNWKVPLFEPDFGAAELAAVAAPVRDGWLTMGQRTEELERALCSATEASHAVAVTNCTAALHMSLLASGIGPGDEVLCPTLTFVATANAIRYVGATPVFCESIGPNNLNIDPDDMRHKLTAKTRAAMVVHYAGYPADMVRISELANQHGISIIEDCAHALFSRLKGRVCGTWGQCGCFSFFSNKNLTCGEGGAVITNDAKLAEKLRLLRSHGMTSLTLDRHRGRAYSYDVVDVGYNFRMDEVRSSLLLAQLGRLGAFLEARTKLSAAYRDRLSGSVVVVPDFNWTSLAMAGDSVGYHIMPVLLPANVDRLRVMADLREVGVQSSIHYPPIHRFSSFASGVRLPRTEALAERQLTLPLYPGMTDNQVELTCSALLEAVNRQC